MHRPDPAVAAVGPPVAPVGPPVAPVGLPVAAVGRAVARVRPLRFRAELRTDAARRSTHRVRLPYGSNWRSAHRDRPALA